ncbi:hypothetical protein [Burkholderia cepacia]|uniref:hypothetical protein n=1 Tax=Burkholderia cepacia TaxID=292 RepID=UPI002AB7D79C|nr:hypothetical protein [Burkholderia cepacia]
MNLDQDIIAGLLDYTIKYAEVNGEPEGGDCRQVIARAEACLRATTSLAAQQHGTVSRFRLMHSGINPHQYEAEVARTGDAGIYEEVRISVFDRDANCVADTLVGLTEHGEVRVLVTAGGDGDNEHQIAVFPTRSADTAIERWEG